MDSTTCSYTVGPQLFWSGIVQRALIRSVRNHSGAGLHTVRVDEVNRNHSGAGLHTVRVNDVESHSGTSALRYTCSR